ncbi:hypothetical protein Tco_1154534 [Tanacetum coccineum]
MNCLKTCSINRREVNSVYTNYIVFPTSEEMFQAEDTLSAPTLLDYFEDQRFLYFSLCSSLTTKEQDIWGDFQHGLEDEEDTRSSTGYMDDLEMKFHERALLANSKRFFKNGLQGLVVLRQLTKLSSTNVAGMVTLLKNVSPKPLNPHTHHLFKSKPNLNLLQTSFINLNKGQPKILKINITKSNQRWLSNASTSKSTQVKNKGLVVEAYVDDEEEVLSNDNELIEVKVLMALVDDEIICVGKESAKNESLNPELQTNVTDSSVTEYDFANESNSVSSTPLPPLENIKVYIHNHKDYFRKFDAKADDGYILEYTLVSKAYKVFNTRRQQVKETLHITFDESTKAIRFSNTNTSSEDITIVESKRFPSDKYLHPFEPSQKFQVNNRIIHYVQPNIRPEPFVTHANVTTDQNDQPVQNDEILNVVQTEYPNHTNHETIIDHLKKLKRLRPLNPHPLQLRIL